MRVQNSVKNIIFGLSGQFISAILGFMVRTVTVYFLGIEYVGVEGLFSSILMMLSLTNLGFDTAIVYSLYKPLAENDYRKICGLMRLYKNAYRIIGIIVFFIGIFLFPFLPYLMNGTSHINNINLIYLLFLLNSVLSYFLVYKQSVLIADQRNHIISKLHSYFVLISNTLQIIMILVTSSYVLALCIQIICRVIENLIISWRTNKLYPFLILKNNDKLTKIEKKTFLENLFSIFLYKISGVVINGTDNIIISRFIGLSWVGIYSNYLLIISTINTFLGYIFHSITASVGNLNVIENKEKKYFIFNVLYFISFWIYGFCAISLWCLLNPFINIWIGSQYLFNNIIVFSIILNFFTSGMQTAATTFRETTGLFKKGKYRPIIAVIINLISSIILVEKIGLSGVLLGTVISRLFTYFWYDPYVIYKYVFKKSVKEYFFKYFVISFCIIIAAIITNTLCVLVSYNPIVNIIIRSVLCIIVPNVIFLLMFRKSSEFKYLTDTIKGLASKRFSKVRDKKLISM